MTRNTPLRAPRARLSALLLVLFALIAPQGAAASEYTYRVVGVASNDVLNVRDRVGVPGSTIVGILPPGTRGIVWTGQQGRAGDGGLWKRVIHPNIPAGGWVNARFLQMETAAAPVQPAPAPAPEGPASKFKDHTAHERPWRVVGVAPNDVLNIRSAPGVSNPIVGVFPPDARGVRITGRIRTLQSGAVWAEVRGSGLPGGTGWVNGRFIDPM